MSPESPSAREAAIAGAKQTIREYYGLKAEVAGDKSVDLSQLEGVLGDPALTQQTDYFTRFRDQGFSSNGEIKLDWMKVRKVDLFPKKRQAAISVQVCYNLEDIETRNRDGALVDPISPGLAKFEVYNDDYPSDRGWMIAVEDVSAKRCRS